MTRSPDEKREAKRLASRLRSRRYRERHPAANRLAQRRYREHHPEAARLKTQRFRERHPEHGSWRAMLDRCYNPAHESFAWYGLRGIAVSPEWRHDFPAFLEHVGPRPGPGYSIDRIDNDLGYFPGNVRWSTAKEQRANQRPTRHRKPISEPGVTAGSKEP